MGRAMGRPWLLSVAPWSRAGRPGKSSMFTWWKWFWRFQSFWEPPSSPTSTPSWTRGTPEIREQHPEPQTLLGRDEGTEPEPEKDFLQDFSPSFGSLEVSSSSSGMLPGVPAAAVPFPTPAAALGGDRSCPSPGCPEVVLAFPSQPSQPNPKF